MDQRSAFYRRGGVLRALMPLMISASLMALAGLVWLVCALPFPHAAVVILLVGILPSAMLSIYEVRTRKFLGSALGAQMRTMMSLNWTQGGASARSMMYVIMLLSLLLWPSRAVDFVFSALLRRSGRSEAQVITFRGLLFPRFLLFLPILCISMVCIYRSVGSSFDAVGWTDKTALLIATICLYAYLFLVLMRSFQDFVDRNVVQPTINASFIALQLLFAIVSVVACWSMVVEGRQTSLGASTAVILDMQTLGSNAKTFLSESLASKSHVKDLAAPPALTLLMLSLWTLFTIAVVRTLLKGPIFRRSEDARLDIAQYYYIVGREKDGNRVLRPVDNENKRKQQMLAANDMYNGHFESAYEHVGKYLAASKASDTVENRLIVFSGLISLLPPPAAGADPEHEKAANCEARLLEFILQKSTHSAFPLVVLREFLSRRPPDESALPELSGSALGGEVGLRYAQLSPVLGTLGKPPWMFPKEAVKAAIAAMTLDLDVYERSVLALPIFQLWTGGAIVEERFEQEVARNPLAKNSIAPVPETSLGPGADIVENAWQEYVSSRRFDIHRDDSFPDGEAFLDQLFIDIIALPRDVRTWQAFVLLTSVGHPFTVLRLSGLDVLIPREIEDATEAWFNRLANDAFPGIANIDLEAFHADMAEKLDR